MSYLKIPNLYKKQDILLFRECYAMEKVHGTSAHIIWNGTKVIFFSGGASHLMFIKLFDETAIAAKFAELFAATPVIIYGEAAGGSMQAMSHTYGKNLFFIVFEAKVGDRWLSVPQAEEVCKALGLEFVPYNKIETSLEAINRERDANSIVAIRRGMGEGHIREGVVLHPLVEMTLNSGERVICKHKRAEFAEHTHPPKVVDPSQMEVMQNAEAIASNWCTTMRLEHILDKMPEATGMEHTPLVIKAMIEDIYEEGKGEIVESKEAATAIGRLAAKLWKARVQTIKEH